MTAKRKIYIITLIWIVLCAAMLTYFFKFMENSNSDILGKITAQKNELEFYRVEERSFQQAERDLEQMKKQTHQPSGLFSTDLAFVNELRTMENLGKLLNIDLSLSGISGTVKSAAKAGTVSDIVVIPYGISIAAPFPKVVDFLEILENLDFATTVSSVTLTASGGQVNAGFSANFYLKRQ